MIDVTKRINAIHRSIGTRMIEPGEARTITITQACDTGIDDVWDACTNPERLPRWFLPVSGDLRLNGTYQLQGNAGGTIQKCDPPRSFAATWEFGGEVSWIEVRLTSESADRTRLELQHIAMAGEHWDNFGPGAVGVGWELGFLGLALHLGGAEAVDPAEFEAWSVSPEGKRFVELSSQGWCEADVAAGTDDATARKRAQRTAAFYTGASAESPSS